MTLLLALAHIYSATSNSSENLRIAIVSEKAFHLEVLAGFTHILEEYRDNVTVYMHPLNFDGRTLDFGFSEFQVGFQGSMRPLPLFGIPHFDLIIFVSPEYRVHYVRDLIQRSQPTAVLFMVHNGDAAGVPELPTLHPNTFITTLAPHVKKFVEARLNFTVDWMLPLKALQTEQPCESGQLHVCLAGFAMQVGCHGHIG